MNNDEMLFRTWYGDWKSRLQQRIRSHGCESMTEFMRKHPAIPYVALASLLGDTAGFQIQSLQFEEATDNGALRPAAMDALVRELHKQLPEGWPETVTGYFPAAMVYAFWGGNVCDGRKELDPLVKATWEALRNLSPAQGWLPKDVDDQLVVKAFELGWPVP